ncbi:acyl-coenzyme A amino acid N-acyltransferase 1-like [Pelobates cultripes]|uniref:Acyl-coenzyme A amino acid N-acyltransferase 1-like n=1 Tax=Pelobates cultripes TaxID=61616 RepID=A0AAD1WB82_PELCU|nr:acyl-coenzyme A amino acid N-acyltransferase 1-like [Pelobates cultripes]
MVGLAVSPEVALADEPVKIHAWGLPPHQRITLRAWLKDEKGQMFQSRAFYKTDSKGNVDLDHAAATGGDFQGVHPMGLFWSLKPSTPFLRLIKRDVMNSPFHVHLELYLNVVVNPFAELPVASKVVERWYVAPGVQRIQIKQGRVRGALFLPPGDGPFPGVIDMFGGVGGLVEFRSSLLASRGFASLALAYFAYDDLPSYLGIMELEYFEEAANVLLRNPKVLGDGVGVVAVCKGAEIALAMASYLPQVKATVCINGTNAVTGNSLSYRDLQIDGIPYQVDRILVTHFGSLELTHTLGDTKKPEYEDCILPLEKARGPILFLVGEEDRNYDSLTFSKEAKTRAEKFGKKDVHVHSFPGAGHLLEPPGAPFCPVSKSTFFPLPLTWGGELIAHCKAQETCWRETQDFLRINIAGCPRQSKL